LSIDDILEFIEVINDFTKTLRNDASEHLRSHSQIKFVATRPTDWDRQKKVIILELCIRLLNESNGFPTRHLTAA
jgi:hypothetical protein